MTISMYEASIPAFINMLNSLSAILDKGAAYAADKNIDPSVLLNARLAPDMFALTRQVQVATDMVKNGAARLAGVEAPSFPDTESSFDELKARIAKTVAFLQGIDAAHYEGAQDRTITMKVGPAEVSFPGKVYLFEFVIPNFYFHSGMAYAILRHNGLGLAKADFLAGLGPYFGR